MGPPQQRASGRATEGRGERAEFFPGARKKTVVSLFEASPPLSLPGPPLNPAPALPHHNGPLLCGKRGSGAWKGRAADPQGDGFTELLKPCARQPGRRRAANKPGDRYARAPASAANSRPASAILHRSPHTQSSLCGKIAAVFIHFGDINVQYA